MRMVLISALVVALAGVVMADDGMPCEGLAKLSLPHGEVSTASMVAKGAFVPPVQPGRAPNPIFATLPGFCRVTATLRPVADSEIKIEVWLPAEGWNGRLVAAGNGGFSSVYNFQDMAQALMKGSAATATNTGHDGNDSLFAIGHPEKLVDWEYRAVHEMAVAAKLILAARFGGRPHYSYWSSCSTGGRQGLVAAELYPEDFDGIVVGAAANPMTRVQAGGLWAHWAFNQDEASFIPPEKWAMIHRAVVGECDAVDGLKDGLIDDPRKCGFDAATLLCKNGDAADCLTTPQFEALGKVVAGPANPRTKEPITPGYPLGMAMLPGGAVAGKNPDRAATTVFRFLFQDPNWDIRTIDFDKDVSRADALAGKMNASDEARLRVFFARGGKLLIYHGWEDGTVSPLSGIQYYEKAAAANGGRQKTDSSVRLFMIPGMGHCSGGEGPSTFDKLDVISKWVERGKAPDSIVASHVNSDGKADRTRPLCPYPQVSRYKGTGSIDDAQNFVCKDPSSGR